MIECKECGSTTILVEAECLLYVNECSNNLRENPPNYPWEGRIKWTHMDLIERTIRCDDCGSNDFPSDWADIEREPPTHADVHVGQNDDGSLRITVVDKDVDKHGSFKLDEYLEAWHFRGSRHRDFVPWWCAKYEYTQGTPYNFTRKDTLVLESLLEIMTKPPGYDLDELKERASNFLTTTEDHWINTTDRSLSVFERCINKPVVRGGDILADNIKEKKS